MKKFGPIAMSGALASVVILAGCGSKSPVAETEIVEVITGDLLEVDPAEALATFQGFLPSPGMSREEVEAVLGDPDHYSRTKDGKLFLIYSEQAHYKSIIYSDQGTVEVAYPEEGAPLESASADSEDSDAPKIDLDFQPENPARPKGALTGATVYVNAGHGWLYNTNVNRWVTQRGVSHGTIEDHSNVEAVMQYLVPFLENTGAEVVTTRERNLNPHSVIVDSKLNGLTLTGAWTKTTIDGAYGDTLWSTPTVAEGEATATATFAPTIPADGHYAVYGWWSKADSGTTSINSTFEINHAAGTTEWVQNQNHDTQTWTYLGTYYFEKGASADAASVVINNATGYADQQLTMSAIRFGGGSGDLMIAGAPMTKPLFEISGLYTAQLNGLNPANETRNFNSVSAMPMYAEWASEPHEKGKAIYLGWHTNASAKGASRGLSSFIYSSDSWGPVERFTGFPGSVELVQAVHGEVIKDVRTAIEPEWRDIGIITRWLGETNPRNNSKMPAALIEYGFHDNVDDAKLILDPNFRRVSARATMQGVVNYFAQNVDGFDIATFPPEAPKGLSVTAVGDDLHVSWIAPDARVEGDEDLLGDAATGYLIQTSHNGKAFDEGVPVTATETIISGRQPGELVYVRVIATNDGGRSFPSEVLAASLPHSENKGRVLFVNSFDRLDGGMNLVQEDGAQRGLLEKMNTFDYVIQHAEAIRAAGYAVDSASDELIYDLLERDYAAVIWGFGQENTISQDRLDVLERSMLKNRRVILSGSNIIGQFSGGTMDLPVALISEDAGTRSITTQVGGLFDGIGNFALNGNNGRTYPAQNLDTLTPIRGAEAALVYTTGAVAAVEYTGDYKALIMGFPFETVTDPMIRNWMMERMMTWITE